MARTAAEIESDLEALRASGADMRQKKAQDLRAELKALGSAPSAPAGVAAEPTRASDDIAFISEALAQLLLKGKGSGKIEQSYSDIRSLLFVKHLLEDAAGLTPTNRVELPEWSTLDRDRDTGEKFKPGENQAVVDGLAQRGAPNRAPAQRPVVTNRDGAPLSFATTRTINEPEGAATFVTQD